MRPLSAILLCASLAVPAAADYHKIDGHGSLHSPPALRALALLNTEDDDAQVAGVVSVDAASGAVTAVGSNFSWSTQASTSRDCATAFAADGAGGRWLSVIGAGPSIAAVDAATGALLGVSPPLTPPYVIASMSWDARAGALVAVAQASDGSVDLVVINATSGAVAPIATKLAGLPFPEPCQSAISLATGTLYVVGLDAANDDADQVVEAFTLDGVRTASVPWPATTAGAVGRPVAVPPAAAGGNDDLVLIWAAPDAGPARPLRYLQLDVRTAAQRVLAELPQQYAGAVVDIGGQSAQAPARAADGSFSLTALVFDNPTDAQLLLRVGPIKAGASGPPADVALTALNAGAGFLWSPVTFSQ